MGEWRNPRGHSDRPIMGASQKKISNQILKNMISRITYQSKSLWNIILKAKNRIIKEDELFEIDDDVLLEKLKDELNETKEDRSTLMVNF